MTEKEQLQPSDGTGGAVPQPPLAQVTFQDVGPRKLSWSATLKQPITYGALVKQIRKHKALGSREIEFADNGAIYVGMCRRVGSWSITYGEPLKGTPDHA